MSRQDHRLFSRYATSWFVMKPSKRRKGKKESGRERERRGDERERSLTEEAGRAAASAAMIAKLPIDPHENSGGYVTGGL